MARRALVAVAIGAIGLIVGAAIAGSPQNVTSDVLSSRLPEVATTLAPTTATAPRTASATSTEVSEMSPAPATSAPPVTSSTDVTTSTSTTTSTTSQVPALVPESELRLVVANATDSPGLAARTIADLRAIGYADSVPTDALDSRRETVIFFVEGRAGEAQRLAAQLSLDASRVQPRGTDQLTYADANGEIWLLLGADST